MERKNFALSPAQRMDARNALEIIGDRPITLTDCVKIALQLPGTGIASSIPISQAVHQYLTAIDVRDTTMGFYQANLWRFLEEIGHKSTGDLTAKHIRTYIDTLSGGRPQMFRTLRAFLRWCHRQDPPLISEDIMARITAPKAKERAPQFLSLEKAHLALHCPQLARYRHAIALGMFAGLRIHELTKLRWEAISKKDKTIRIDGEVAKTGRARIIENAPAILWTHLADAPENGPVLTCGAPVLARALRYHVPGYPPNALRHSFATYHVAAYRNPADTALILGHEGGLQLLYTRYRGLAAKADGEAYFAGKSAKGGKE